MALKICPCCKKVKILETEFNAQRKYCLVCHRAKGKAWRQANPNKDKECQRRFQRKWKRAGKCSFKSKCYIFDHLKSHPCVDCHETNPLVLEFDHVRGKKIKAISVMLSNGSPLKCIAKEIEKCDIRCANCHAIKTAKERGSWKFLFQ